MSWFGETFGDSLTSLKGQITKITKEVLADDAASQDNNLSNLESNKELQALCDSKDLEIASLKDENERLEKCLSELELSKSNNKRNNSCKEGSQVDKLSQLENELLQLRKDRDDLNLCLDELQSEHQINLNEAVSIKDKYKKELEELKKEYSVLKLKVSKLDEAHEKESQSHIQNTEDEDTKEKLNSLKSEVESLQCQLLICEKEKNESVKALETEKLNSSNLKSQLQKLSEELDYFKRENSKTLDEISKIQLENENLKKSQIAYQKEKEELQFKYESLLTENQNYLKQSSISVSDNNYWSEFHTNLKNMLEKYNIKFDGSENGFVKTLNLIENIITNHQKDVEIARAQLKESKENFELETNKLKELNGSLQNEIKVHNDKWREKEKKYLTDIKAVQQKLDEATSFKSKILEMEKKNEANSQSQTDDVKKLEQEVTKLLYLCDKQTNEISDLSKSKQDLEQKLKNLETESNEMKNQLLIKNSVKKLEDEVLTWKNKEAILKNEIVDLEKKHLSILSENTNLTESNKELKSTIQELQVTLRDSNFKNSQFDLLQNDCNAAQSIIAELKKSNDELQKKYNILKEEAENCKAQIIIRESSLSELMKSNTAFQDEINKLQANNIELQKSQKEIEKWRSASIDLEIQRQDLSSKIEVLENEILNLNSNLELQSAKDTELQQLKQANNDLVQSCNRLHKELESKIETEQLYINENKELKANHVEQSEIIAELKDENKELNSRILKFQEEMKVQFFRSLENSKNEVSCHKRSKSAADSESICSTKFDEDVQSSEEIKLLKASLQNMQEKYKKLIEEFENVSKKESSAKKEFERLRQHLIEVEDHYTEEAIESEKIINDLKSKLMAAEEQIKNSSTLYTSAKIRDNQHLESLQSQVRLVSAQRDDFQNRLSAAEDEIQKHKASLTSLQIVLEQFQQDKEREMEAVALKYEKQIQSKEISNKKVEFEIEGLQKQLGEAKQGLQAASRLGEQLEKKTQKVFELEQNIGLLQCKVEELENNLKVASQSASGKVDKSLVKNLVEGYILSPKADRKAQALRILASVLDFDSTERKKMGVDTTNSGWLGSILHPKSGGSLANESLSEAFIKFLENESRPQPQLKISSEQFKGNIVNSSGTSQKPREIFSELTLPTFNSLQDNESSIILKNVLKDN